LKSKYTITGEVRPPLEIIKTSRGRELFHLKPISTTQVPPVLFKVSTPFEVVKGQPFLVTTVKSSQKFGVVSSVKGQSFSPIGKGTTQKFRSVIETQKLFKLKSLSKSTFKATKFKAGRTITRTESSTQLKPLYKTSKFEVVDARTLFKDVTKATGTSPRLSGKFPKLETTITRLRDPIIKGTSGVNFIKPAPITKTAWSKTFGGQTTQQFTSQITKRIPITPTIKIVPQISPIPIGKTIVTSSVIPKIVGGLGATAPSLFAGQGTYEKTFENVGIVTRPTVKTKQELDLTPKFEFKPITKTKVKVITVSGSKTITKPLVKFQSKLVFKPELKTELKPQIKTPFTSPSPTFRFPKPRVPTTSPPLIPFLFPPLKFGSFGEAPPSFGRPFRFQAGLSSIALGRTAFKIPKLSFTGLATRPIVTTEFLGEKKKKRKGRKK